MQEQSRSLAGTVAVVTGAGAGLGRAAALHLARAGATVVGLSLLSSELQALEQAARQDGAPLKTMAVDVGTAEQVHEAATSVLTEFGRVDLLINNAGIIVVKPIDETSVEEWDRVMATNLRSAFLLTREFVPAMKHQSGGLIINVSSRSGVEGFVGECAYCPSKFGLEGLTKTLALELESWGIWVVSVTPGMGMKTPMSMTTYTEAERRRWRDPAELAPGFEVLAREVNGRHTGQRFDVWRLAQSGSIDGAHDENMLTRGAT